MANRVWVGGTANWDATAGLKWSLTSGGAGGQTVPSAADDVFFDSNSGVNTITINAPATAKSITCTGFTGTIAGTSTLAVGGNILLVVGMGFTYTGTLSFVTSGLAVSFTSAGKTFAAISVSLGAVTRTITLQDDLTMTGTLTSTSGNINFNNKNATMNNLVANGAIARTLTLGSGTITLTGTGAVWAIGTGPVIVANTSTMKITNNSGTSKSFNGGSGNTYNNLWFAPGSGTATFTLNSDNTWSDIKDDGTSAHTFRLLVSANTTTTTLTINGTPGNLISFQSTSVGTQATLTVTSGTITTDYLIIQDINAVGGATFNAGVNSRDGGNNFGWIFPNSANFFSFM